MSDLFPPVVGLDVLSLCGPSAFNRGAWYPTTPLLAGEVARRLFAAGEATGLVETADSFVVRLSAGRYKFGALDELRRLVGRELTLLGDQMLRLGQNTPGAVYYIDAMNEDMKRNDEYAKGCTDMIKCTTRFVNDMTHEVAARLECVSLFKKFNLGSGVPCADGVWEDGALREYSEEDRFISWLPLSYEGPVNQVAVKAMNELIGDCANDFFEALADGLICRRKQLALLLYGPDGGEGKTTCMEFYDLVVGTEGAISSGSPCRGNVFDDDKFLFGTQDSVHPSAGFGFVGCSVMTLPDLADRQKVNLGNLVKVVAGSVVPVREMNKSFRTSGMKIPVTATLVMQANSLLGMDQVWSTNPVERRILGIHVMQLGQRTLNEVFALDLDEREAAARGLLHLLLEMVSPITWKGSEEAWEQWRRLLFESTEGAEGLTERIGLRYTGRDEDVLWLTGIYDWAERAHIMAPQSILRKAFSIRGSITHVLKLRSHERTVVKRARGTYVRGWLCELDEGIVPDFLEERIALSSVPNE